MTALKFFKSFSIATALVACLAVCNLAHAEIVVDIDSLTDLDGTDFSTNYGGGIGTGLNNTFSGTAAILNGATSGATTYSAADVFVATSKNEFTGNFGVSNNGGSGWRIRLNSSNTSTGKFYSDNLFAVNNVSFNAANDTLNASEIFISDMAAVSSGTIRFVVRDGGSFFISDADADFQTGALTGNLIESYSIEALTANWFNYDPTTNPTTSGVTDIGAAAAPTFTDIDFIGFHLEVAAAGGVQANFGVREFSATAIPEPTSLALFGLAIGMTTRRRRS